MGRPSQRVDYLDSIRGLASLFVLLSHAGGAFVLSPGLQAIMGMPFVIILFGGKEAVVMFFVLSGYVLSKPYVVAGPDRLPPRRLFLPTFYLRRFTRIWLPWFAVFCCSIVAQKFLFSTPSTQPPITPWLDQFWHAAPTAQDFFRQCVFILHDPKRQLLNQDWSLGVELKGSILIPIFLFLARPQRVWSIMLCAVLFVVLVGNGAYYCSFISGVLLAQYGDVAVAKIKTLSILGRASCMLLGLLFYQAFHFITSDFGAVWSEAGKYGWLVSTIGCALILLCVFASDRLQKLLTWRPVVWLGRISYSVYLLQFIVILCLLPKMAVVLNRMGMVQSPLIFLLTLVVGVGVTLTLAWVTYHIIEVPAINLGHWLTRRLSQWDGKSPTNTTGSLSSSRD